MCLRFSLRIVAARLNGSLDFFSLETHTSLNHLQFRGKQVSEHAVRCSELLRAFSSSLASLQLTLPHTHFISCRNNALLQNILCCRMPNQLLRSGEEYFGSSLCRESVSSAGFLQCLGLEAETCVPGSALPRTSFLSHFSLIFSFSKICSHSFAHHVAPHNHDTARGLGTTTTHAKAVRGGNWFAVQWLLWF